MYTYTNIISETLNITCSAIPMRIWVPFQATNEIITIINNIEKVHYIYMISHLS